MAVLGSGNVQIDTYGELKTLIKAITMKQKGLKIKGIIIDTIADELIGKLPGGPTARKTLDFVKAAFGKPDSVKTNTWLDRLDVDDQLSAIVDDTVENKFLQDISKRIEGQSDNTPLRQDFNMNTELVDFLKKNYKGRTVVGPQNEIKKMKKSQLKQLVLEVMRGYSKYAPGGTTSGGTTADFATILKNVALGKDQVTRGNDTLDKANPDNVARISRGEKPIYEGEGTLLASEIREFIKQTLNLQDYDVDVRFNPAYNEIKLTIKQDPSKEDFNTITNYLEDNGYTVDYNQSTREGEDDGDRYYYPRIRFS